MANIIFWEPETMSIRWCRPQNVPFISRVEPSQLTDYEICETFKNTCFEEHLRMTASETHVV